VRRCPLCLRRSLLEFECRFAFTFEFIGAKRASQSSGIGVEGEVLAAGAPGNPERRCNHSCAGPLWLLRSLRRWRQPRQLHFLALPRLHRLHRCLAVPRVRQGSTRQLPPCFHPPPPPQGLQAAKPHLAHQRRRCTVGVEAIDAWCRWRARRRSAGLRQPNSTYHSGLLAAASCLPWCPLPPSKNPPKFRRYRSSSPQLLRARHEGLILRPKRSGCQR
jgi:hypothetical protein